MFARVIKCSEDTFWYSDRIGEVFPVQEVSDEDLWSILKTKREKDFFRKERLICISPKGFFLKKSDVEIVPDAEIQAIPVEVIPHVDD